MKPTMMKPQEQMQAMLDWLTATAHAGAGARYDLGIGDANKALYFRRDGLKSLSMADIHHRLGFFKAANAVGVEAARRSLNIYITAAVADPQSWLMLDDIESVERCHEIAGERSRMIIQTSPGSHHLWLSTSRPMTSDERKLCQQILQRRYGGDDGSTSGDHFGRLCGFKNAKRNCWVNLVDAVITDRRADVDKLLALVAEMGLGFSIPHGGVVSSSLLSGVAPQARAPSLCHSVSSSFSSTGRDESIAEFRFACESLKRLATSDSIIRDIADRALSRGKCRTAAAANRYASRTVDAAARAIAG